MYSTETELTNDILKLQADILGEDVKTDHPYLKKNKSASKSKQLITDRGFIVGAINELKTDQDSLQTVTEEALATVYSVLGQIGSNLELKERVLQEAPSLIELVLEMNNQVNEIKNKPSVTNADIAKMLEDLDMIKSYNEEIIDVTDDSKVFVLEKSDIDFNSIKFFVNGIYYPNNSNSYTIDEENNTLTWIADSEHGGFDLKDSQVIISYDYRTKTEEETNNG